MRKGVKHTDSQLDLFLSLLLGKKKHRATVKTQRYTVKLTNLIRVWI